jgi:uncharacterized protein
MKKWHIPYAVVYLTGACNLSCSYCFANKVPPSHMSRETGRAVVRWLFENTVDAPENPLILSFFGGEPLINDTVLKDMVKFGRELSPHYNKDIIFSLTTNGTLINEEILDFLEEYKISILFSIDGDKETNDMHRIFKDGRSSSSLIIEKARAVLDRFPNTAARMTIVDKNLDLLANNIKFLHELGFKFISPCPAPETLHDHKQWVEFDRQCRLAADYVIDCALQDNYLHLHFLDNGIDQIIHQRDVEVSCGAGKTFVGIDVNGGIYPCHRFVSYALNEVSPFRLGDVYRGIDPVKSLPFRRYNRKNILGCYTRCSDCPAKDFCAGGCIALNQEITGNFLMPPVQQQKLMAIWNQICMETINSLKQLGKYDQLVEEIQKKPKSFHHVVTP